MIAQYFIKIIATLFSWLAERLRDVAMWPINFLRDFPARNGRLLRTLWIPITRQAEFPHWVRRNGRFLFWLHRLLNELFDWVGGPEIAQFMIHLISNTTPLTGDEIGKVATVFGSEGMRYGDVRIAQGGLLKWIFKLNGNLAFATWHTIHLPGTGKHVRSNWPLLMHELTHVYQYEYVGTRYLGEAIYMLIKTKRDCYDYGGVEGLETAVSSGKNYRDYNREQQAMIVQDYCTLKKQEVDITPYLFYLSQLCTRAI